MKKALIIGSMDNYYGEETQLSGSYQVGAPPLAPLAVASYLKANGIPVEMIDIEMDFGATLNVKDMEVVYKRLCDYLRVHADEYAWVGLSMHASLSFGLTKGFSLVDQIHAALPNTPLVLGGYFATFFYEDLFKKYPFVAAIVRGSAEVSVLHVAQRIAKGEPIGSADIPNLAWVENGKARATPIVTPPLKDLPVIDFSLLRNAHAYEKIDLQSARGCIFKCDFCPEDQMRQFDAYPLEWFKRQLENIEANTTTDIIQLWDPMFGIGLERTLDIAKIIAERPRKYHWAFLGRADTLPLDALPALRAAGMESIFFGVETASPKTLVAMRKINNPNVADKYVKQQLDAITACFENDITPFLSLMTGYPGDVKEDYHMTLALLDEMKSRAERAPTQPGFGVTAQVTHIYDNTVLKDKVDEHKFGDVKIAERRSYEANFTSDDLTLEQIEDYGMQMIQKSAMTDSSFNRWHRFWMRPGQPFRAFLDSHPEVHDKDGVFQPVLARGMQGYSLLNL